MTDTTRTEEKIAALGKGEVAAGTLREEATADVARSVGRLEELLRAALQGGRLRGCPNLTPDWASRGASTGHPGATEAYRGWRLRGGGKTPLDPATLAGGGQGRPALVVNERGLLVEACRVIHEDDRREVVEAHLFEVGSTRWQGLRTGDLVAYLEVLEEALDVHRAAADQAGAHHAQAQELAKLVERMLDESDRLANQTR